MILLIIILMDLIQTITRARIMVKRSLMKYFMTALTTVLHPIEESRLWLLFIYLLCEFLKEGSEKHLSTHAQTRPQLEHTRGYNSVTKTRTEGILRVFLSCLRFVTSELKKIKKNHKIIPTCFS